MSQRIESPLRRRGLGVGFIVLVVFFLWLTFAIYNKVFTPFVEVRLITSNVGLQMNEGGDVKLRGVIVGTVREIEALPDGSASMLLGIYPEHAHLIPVDATADILPKTLFGAKYVSLNIPQNSSGEVIQAGDVINNDRTDLAIEIEQVLSNLQPLLEAVRPADLAFTLQAGATALEGRGERLGDNLVTLNDYLTRLEPEIPLLLDDLTLLADVSVIYNDIAPDLLRLLANTTTTGDTIVEEQDALTAFFADTTELSDITREFLAANEDALIRLAPTAQPTLDLLARYSPSFTCFIEGINNLRPIVAETLRGHILHAEVEILPQQAESGYTLEHTPELGNLDAYGPDCYSLPNPPWNSDNPAPIPPKFMGVEQDDGVEDMSFGRYRPVPGGDTEISAEELNDTVAESLGVTTERLPAITALMFEPLTEEVGQ